MSKARITIEFDIEENNGADVQTVLNGVTLLDDDIVDGFCLTTILKGFDNTSDYFLSNGRIIRRELIKNGK